MTKPSHTPSRESGQAIILIVFAFIGLLAFVGIVVDLGRYLVYQTQLRRAVDAAALAGAAQFRLAGSTTTDDAVYDKVSKAALASLNVHGITCGGCADIDPPTKKVRVRVDDNLPLIFLSLIGWRTIDVNAESTTEAASVDVALVLDISDSMASDGCGGGDYPCVFTCDTTTSNDLNTDCHPFYEVKEAARAFLDYLSLGYDRVTVIPFGLYPGYCINPGDDPENWFCPASAYDPGKGLFGDKYVPLTTDLDAARTFIENLDIAIPDWAGASPTYPIPPCPNYSDNPPAGPSPTDWDPRQCTNTNIGGGLKAGATELLKEFDTHYPGGGPNHISKERLRVVILLTDGSANASGLGPEEGMPDYTTGLQIGYCPQTTWLPPGSPTPFCRAEFPGFTIATGRHISTSAEYDANDYTLDWADFAMLEAPVGNQIVMFTIGLGNQLIANSKGDPAIGEKLMRYIAAGGDDFRLDTNPCAGVPVGQSCGNYYFAPSGAQLLQIFQQIAGRIFTRINN
jgi:Flp pilus assembly protein TadG